MHGWDELLSEAVGGSRKGSCDEIKEVVQIQISSLQQAIIASLPLNRRFNNEDK